MGQREVLDSVLQQIKKRFGEGSIMWLGDRARADAEVIPTGSLGLDIALGIGGLPQGRIVEVFGAESSGKTTLALHFIAAAQRSGGAAAFIDAEHALDPQYARAIGVNVADLLLSQPNSGEQALEICESLVRSGAIQIIVIDSVAALVPEAEIAGAMGDSQVGLQARLMSQAMRKLAAAIGQSKSIVVFINQLRSLISATPYGPTTTTTGGLALKFYASLRLETRRIGTLEDAGQKIGHETMVRVVKNKLAPPFREAKFDIVFGQGIARERELLRLGEQWGLVQKSGAWFTYGEKQLGQGLANAATALRQESTLAEQIESEIRARAGLTAGSGSPAEASPPKIARNRRAERS